MTQHDFEFQFGPNRTLKGKGLLGVAALAIIVAGIVLLPTNAGRLVSGIPSAATSFLVAAHIIRP